MAMTPPAMASAPSARDQQYDLLRKRAKQQGVQAGQEQGEALKRRFAAMGNLNSGAFVKAAGQQEQMAQAATQEAVQNVDFAQSGEKAQAEEAEKGRIFNRELFDKDQEFKKTVFADESKFRGLNAKLAQDDLDESKRANSLNAGVALGNMSDEALRSLGGASREWGDVGNKINIEAILKRYGYGR
jgi:hypothetical protein